MELKVLTLNTWGLFVGGKYIKERFAAIASELPGYDVACLQEVWSRDDYDDLVSQLSLKMPYSHHFKSAIIGSGLCIFSKYPIVSAICHEYRVSVGMKRLVDGEVFAGKGVLCCKIETPQGIVAFFTTHLSGRRKQSHLLELMQFVRHIRNDHPVIITGDFNTSDRHTAYQLITKCLGMADVFSDDPGANTCELKGSPFTKSHCKPKRIDFIFHSTDSPGNVCLKLRSRCLVLTNNIPGKNYPYSDHAGIEAVFTFVETDSFKIPRTNRMSDAELNVLRKISADISEQMDRLYKFNVQKRGKHVILCLVGFLLLAYLFLATLNEVLSDYHFQWITMPLIAVIGAVAMAVFFLLMNEVQLFSGMTANIDEINTIIHYHKSSGNDTRISLH